MVNNKRLLAHSLVITTIVFFIGIFIGYQIDTLRTDDVVESLRKGELEVQSYILEQSFFQQLGGYSCDLAQPKLIELSKHLGELGSSLVTYEQRNVFAQQEYNYLLRKYFLEEIRTYTLFSQLKKDCNLTNNLVLYFFNPDELASEKQGRVLDVFGKKHEGISVFSFNFVYDDPLLSTIKLHYNITQTPTMIVDDSTKIEGFTSLEELEETLGKAS